jgi:squalene-associated FAD-dependent desaturase
MRRRVAVIGAGYAGIAAAVPLAEAGVAVTLYDANRTAGGRARRVDYRGTPLDNGQHLLLGAYRDTLALMRKVGAPADGLLRQPLTLHYPGLLRQAAPSLPAPLHLLAGLAAAEGFSGADRLATFRLSWALRAAEAAAFPGETVRALLTRLSQPERLCRLLWEPLCLAALNTPAAEADARVFSRVMRDALMGARADSDLLLPVADLSALLPDPAVVWLGERGASIRLGQRITRLHREAEAWQVTTPAGATTHDGVVCATAPVEAGALLGSLPGQSGLGERLAAVRHEPIVTVYLQYPSTVALPGPMLGVDGGFAQWVFDRDAIAGARGLVAAVVSATHALGSAAGRDGHRRPPRRREAGWAAAGADVGQGDP